MKYEYFFGSRWRQDLCAYLEKNNVSYKILDEVDNVPRFMKFSVWSNHNECESILSDLYKLTGLRPWVQAHYSEKDFSTAELLTIRPQSIKICIENIDESFRYDCCWSYMADKIEIHKANHEEQIGTIMIKKEPSTTTKTAFWGPDDGGTIIFADKKVFDLVQKENLKGIFFQDILLKNRKISEKVFQMLADHTIQHEDIVLGRGEREQTCPMCGKKQYALPDAYQLHLRDALVYHEIDFFSTERIFGDGIAQPIYLISQRFYQLLKRNKLTAQVDFVPVILE